MWLEWQKTKKSRTSLKSIPVVFYLNDNEEEEVIIWEELLLWTTHSLKNLMLVAGSWSELSEQPVISSSAVTQYYCSSFMWNCTQKYLWFPSAPFILETFWCPWRMLLFASFPYSLSSVVLTGISYILRLSENTRDCWEPFWPGYLPENILLNTEIAASEMNAATPSYLCFGWNSQVPWRYLLCLSGWESRK